MKKYFLILGLSLLFACFSKADTPLPGYNQINMDPVFAKLITRDIEDQVYSGQIKTKQGLTNFEKHYNISPGDVKIDFKTQMLVFGITDNLSSRAFQFLKQEKTRSYVLDYYESGMQYKLRQPDKGKKHSFLQIFILEKIEGIPHIMVKNFVQNGLSKIFE